jgi:NTP pyrophosphatase (non-canonical NTP hydrolase)
MNSKEFIADALKTESNDFAEISERLAKPRTIRLLHAAMGMFTESAEFMDAMKKYIYYGKPLDEVNLGEEVGDQFWYQAIACDELNTDFEAIWEKIIAKLKSRYGDKFNSTGALERNLDTERAILESPYEEQAKAMALFTKQPPELLNWKHAESHFTYVRRQYEMLAEQPGANTKLALALTFKPLAVRFFEQGERTKELFDAMMDVQ